MPFRPETRAAFADDAPPLPNAWLQFLLLGAVYVLINFIVVRHTLSPIHQDDYLALGYGYEDMRLMISRPVSTNLIYLMGALGPGVAFPVLALLTLVVPFLVLRFVQAFFRVNFAWPMVVLLGAVAFSHTSAFEHSKFLGLYTNLTSHLFGLLTLLLVISAWRRRRVVDVVLAAVCFTLSAFAKEDFLLPPLILVALLALEEVRAAGRFMVSRWSLLVAAVIGVVAFAAIAFNFFLSNNPFVSGVAASSSVNDPYAVSMSPVALAKAFAKLTFGYVPVPTTLALVGLATAWWAKPASRLRLLAFTAMLVALILPYAMIPNNMPEYRAFSWLAWFGGAAAVGALWGVDRLFTSGTRLVALARVAVPLGLALAAFVQAYPARAGIAAWYRAQQTFNQAVLASLRQHRAEIARESEVGIIGVDGLSPWSNTDAQYLHRKLYFDNKWIVFVEGDTIFFHVDPVVDGHAVPMPGKQFVTVQQTARICEMPDFLLLQFDSNGNAVALRSRDWCARGGRTIPGGSTVPAATKVDATATN